MSYPWTPIHAQFHTLLKRSNGLPISSRLLVAFSGGQDSLCLLKLLLDLQPKWNWVIATVYCDHRWPPDSGQNADHVAVIARQWKLQHYCKVAPQVLKGEAEGRTWRYQEMTTLALEQNYSVLVTAHTASDRAETLLYHLIRGTGMNGLQSLPSERSLQSVVTLVRPILHLTRSQTGQFCHDLNLPVWEDQMNQDLSYRRNRLRLHVIPYLREHFNPQIDRTLAQTANLLEADVAYLEEQAQTLFAEVHTWQSPAQINRIRLQQAPLALQRRTLRLFLTHNFQRSPNFSQVEKVVKLVYGNPRDRTDPLFGQIIAEVKASHIVLIDLCSQTKPTGDQSPP